jgi:arsenate reductase
MAEMRVLFLCTGNIARSQMAEAFLRKHGGSRFEVQSAGLVPGEDIHPLARHVMSEIGFDLVGQHPKSLRQFLGRSQFDVVIFVCEKKEAGCPILWPSSLIGLAWPFEDPAVFVGDEAQQVEKFRSVRDQIERKILEWLETDPPE